MVVVGAGQAGLEVALCARRLGWAGEVLMLGAEPHLPYARPPLSKALIADAVGEGIPPLRSPEDLQAARIDVRTGLAATAVHRGDRVVCLEDGCTTAYDVLVLATGGRARALPPRLLARPAPNLHALRTLDDAQRLRAALRPGARLAVIGAGFIGLEVAAQARAWGVHVTVLEAAPRVLARSASEGLSAFLAERHCAAGVELLLNTLAVQLEQREPDGTIEGIVCRDGRHVRVDLVLVAIGLLPNSEIAAAAGLAVDDGIVVDAAARTDDPAILAVGDCARFPSLRYGRQLRLESVPHAIQHARAAAATACGQLALYDPLPWFWSDQFDAQVKIVGLVDGADMAVRRGSADSGSFVLFHLRDGVLVAAESVNRAADFQHARRLVAAGLRIDPVRLADDEQPLSALRTDSPTPA